MARGQKIIPYHGVELDTNESSVDDMKAVFIKNLSDAVDDNNRLSRDEGNNAYSWKPVELNERYCNLNLPAGTNRCVGFFYAREVNQAYVFAHNSTGQHFIYRILGDTGVCQMVLVDPCLNFKLNPVNFIGKTRCTVQIVTRFNKALQQMQTVVYIIFTDNDDDQRFICPEDLINTNGFNPVSFPYFATNDPDCERCTWFNLGRPTPMGCIQVTPIVRDVTDEAERTKPNLMNYAAWQFRVKTIDIYGRSSEHGIISEPYFTQTGNSCLGNSIGLARCLKLRFPAGCPLDNQIQISFRRGNVKGLAVESDWYRFATFNKYKDCDANQWWEREISNPWFDEWISYIDGGVIGNEEAIKIADGKGLTRYYSSDNTFEYIFCADKECVPISVNETNRVENPLPRSSGAVFPIGKTIGLARNKRGFEPMNCNELAKVEYTVDPPSPSACSKMPVRKIEIWGVFYNPNNETITRIRTKDGNHVFGYADCSNNNPINFDQIIPKDQLGIIGHLKGTDFYAISKQYRYDRQTGNIEHVGLNWLPAADPATAARYIPVQKWELSVPPGKFRFHLSSHKSTPSDDYKTTSTYFIGRTDLADIGTLVEEQREIIVDVCDSDFILKDTPIMIWDLTHVGKNCTTSSEAASSVAGYLYEY